MSEIEQHGQLATGQQRQAGFAMVGCRGFLRQEQQGLVMNGDAHHRF